jgi:hypothetical protein
LSGEGRPQLIFVTMNGSVCVVTLPLPFSLSP